MDKRNEHSQMMTRKEKQEQEIRFKCYEWCTKNRLQFVGYNAKLNRFSFIGRFSNEVYYEPVETAL